MDTMQQIDRAEHALNNIISFMEKNGVHAPQEFVDDAASTAYVLREQDGSSHDFFWSIEKKPEGICVNVVLQKEQHFACKVALEVVSGIWTVSGNVSPSLPWADLCGNEQKTIREDEVTYHLKIMIDVHRTITREFAAAKTCG